MTSKPSYGSISCLLTLLAYVVATASYCLTGVSLMIWEDEFVTYLNWASSNYLIAFQSLSGTRLEVYTQKLVGISSFPISPGNRWSPAEMSKAQEGRSCGLAPVSGAAPTIPPRQSEWGWQKGWPGGGLGGLGTVVWRKGIGRFQSHLRGVTQVRTVIFPPLTILPTSCAVPGAMLCAGQG